MKVANKKIAIALAISSAAILSGCGKSSPPNNPGLIPGAVAAPGCIPLNQPISFNGSNVLQTPSNIVAGAIPPSYSAYSGQTFGTMALAGAGTVTGGQYSRTNVTGSTITLNIAPIAQNPTGYSTGYNNNNNPYTRGVSITGTVAVSPQTLGYINGNGSGAGYGYGYSPYYPGAAPQPTQPQTQECVSGIALNFTYLNNFQLVGDVYLYVNNTQHGYDIMF